MIRAGKTREAILFRDYCLNRADFCWDNHRVVGGGGGGVGGVATFIIVQTRYLDHLYKCCVKTTTPVMGKTTIVC